MWIYLYSYGLKAFWTDKPQASLILLFLSLLRIYFLYYKAFFLYLNNRQVSELFQSHLPSHRGCAGQTHPHKEALESSRLHTLHEFPHSKRL